jgi:hypothetical protein
MADSGKERALDAVADRTPVDWDALEREAGTEVDRDWIRWVRVLEGVAGLHQADAGEASREDGSQTLPPDDTALTDEGSTSWGKYVLVQKVGEGGFGSVYRAWDPDLQLEVAIKILHRRIADARLKQALLREGRALARIKHENVVRVLGVESHDDQIALRMEFVHGEDARTGAAPARHAQRARGRTGWRGRVPCACGRSPRGVRAPRRQGQERHARKGRAHRSHGLRRRAAGRGSEDSRKDSQRRARLCTWRRR